ncbi:precorrin-3B C(17)-methyltransferase, partial [Candidatus Aerophobetes bacterium]
MCTISWKKGKVNLEKENLSRSYRSHSQGRLYIVGIGPGNTSLLTLKAQKIIEESRVIIGYTTYIRLIDNLIKDKEVISYGMTQEVERAKYAIKRALSGDNVSLISGGDPGVYGMAGVVLQLLDKEEDRIKIEIIPGVTAASSCAALLGAPLMHDFVVISLSDILTDSKLIEQRIELAARGDFVIVFYNPKSKKRVRPLKRAWEILMKYRSGNTIVGIVRNAQRENEEVVITTLKNMLLSKKIDMRTVVIVGNSKTYTKGKFMI